MMMPPDVFCSAVRRRTTTRSCRGRNFTRFAPDIGEVGRLAMNQDTPRQDIGRQRAIVSTLRTRVPESILLSSRRVCPSYPIAPMDWFSSDCWAYPGQGAGGHAIVGTMSR